MRIAIYGDSLADPNHYKYSLRCNSKLSEQDKERTWSQRLIADGHEVTFYTGMSRHPLWVNQQYQDSYKDYDKRIVRCYNWNKPHFNWPDYDNIISRDFLDLVPNQAHVISKFTSKTSPYIQAVESYFKNQYEPQHDAWVMKQLIKEWTSDKDTLFISPALIQDMKFGIPRTTEWILPKLNLVQERKIWLEEIGCTLEQFNKLDPIYHGKMWHKHINHVPIDSHDSFYDHVNTWLHLGELIPIELKAWDYYSKDCDNCKLMEEEIKCPQGE